LSNGGELGQVAMNGPRILVILQNLPYPAFSGVDLRNWQNVSNLIGAGRVGVFGLCSNDTCRAQSPSASLAFWRSSSDPDLSYPLRPDRRAEARAWLLDPLGHPSDLYYSNVAVEELNTVLREFRPEIAVVEELWMHRYIDLLKSYDCRVILDCHNVEASLSQERADSQSGDGRIPALISRTLVKRAGLIERRAVHVVDQLWVCSGHDAQLVETLYKPSAPIRVVPNAVDPTYYDGRSCARDPSTSPPGANKTVVFPAMFTYEPNRVAAAFLIDEIFPLLAKSHPDCRLLLPGNWPTAKMLEAAKTNPRIVVTGPVADIRPYLAAASAMIVPLFQGSGTRFKILEAFAMRVPVISTAKGAEGLGVENERHLLIAESAPEFVECLERLWTNENLAEKLKIHALDLLSRRYSWTATGREIRSAIDEIISQNQPI
jgi:glycosyltransferase involved in cell wall biosynthesis